MNPLQAFKDALAEALYGTTVQEARQAGICVECKEPALPKCYSPAGKKEYIISGLCEQCFDNITRKEH